MSNLKRRRDVSDNSGLIIESETSQKRPREHKIEAFSPIKIASQEAAAAVDANPPFLRLLETLKDNIIEPVQGECIIYWMRMSDLRISDNRALSLASAKAKRDSIPLIVIFVISPQDYVAHDRSARRIDFMLRNLSSLKNSLDELHIPLQTLTFTPRTSIPIKIISFLEAHNCKMLFANIEYEVDELRRDVKIWQLAAARGIQVNLLHDKCIIEPGAILTKQNKVYTMYSPFQKNWIATLNANIPYYLEEYSKPHPNSASIRSSLRFSSLFDSQVPAFVPGFQLEETDRAKMEDIWPEGELVAKEILQRFLRTASSHSQIGAVSPVMAGSNEDLKDSRVMKYGRERDRVDSDTTSRLSPYLSAGVISARACVRATMSLLNTNEADGGLTGIGRWVQELAWRDFYINILAHFPRVSMGRPFLERFADVVWENHQAPSDSTIANTHVANEGEDSEALKRWKDGKTGIPIVDAAMRCIKEMGWLHNRLRMISAMYLTKNLMIDWRVGERYFMETLIDGDLASNNGGWQWSASTGTDACPYFRIFNPYTQSLKADPNGDFIRHWVPELRHLKGPAIHNPPPTTQLKNLGYLKPLIAHDKAKERALRRYKNPGIP